MRKLKLIFLLLIINCHPASCETIINSTAQDSLSLFEFSPTLNTKRVNSIKYATVAAYPLSMYWLYTEWYKSYPQTRFHFFDDETEWEHMDKAGHLVTSYCISGGYAGILRWSGVERRK